MLRTLPLSRLTTNELVITADRIVSAIDEPLTAVFETRTKKIGEASGQLLTALNADRSSDYTARLADADQQRDDAFRSLRHGILSVTLRADAALRAAGHELLDILRRHNSRLYSLSYVAQSAEMKSLLKELEENRTAVKRAALQALLAEMKEAMDRFDTLYQEKVDAESGKNLPVVKENREKLARQLSLLLDHVAILLDDEEDGVATLVEKLNDIITDTVTVLRARQTRQENAEGEDDDPVGEEEDPEEEF